MGTLIAFKDWLGKILRYLMTGKDNRTHDLWNYGLVGAFIVIIAHDAYQLHWEHIPVKITDLAQAFSLLFAAVAAAKNWKAKTDPDPGGNKDA